MAELVPTATKKRLKKQPFMLEERFTYQNVQEELFYKHTKYCCYSTYITTVTVTSNSGVRVSQKNLRENGKRFTCIEYFWLSSGSSKMEGNEKVYFSTAKPNIYPKSLGHLPEILLLP